MPFPNFETLRQVAECASGMRDTPNLCFVITGNTFRTMTLAPGQAPPPSDLTTVYLPLTAVPDSPIMVKQANISDVPAPGPTVNLMALTVPAIGAYPGFGPGPADAVFWSLSAVEKFLLPYYASVYGNQAPDIVKQVMDILEPVTTGPQPYAIVHLPSSEYAEAVGVGVGFPPGSNPVSDDMVEASQGNGQATPGTAGPPASGERAYFDDMFLLAAGHAVPLTPLWRTHLAAIPGAQTATAHVAGATPPAAAA
jgi:hypothetical protein